MIKHLIANCLWRICKISPEMGNLVMDLLGDYKNYQWVMRNQTLD